MDHWNRNKDGFYGLEDELMGEKTQFNGNSQYLLDQFDQPIYDQPHANNQDPHNMAVKLGEEFNLDNYQFVLPESLDTPQSTSSHERHQTPANPLRSVDSVPEYVDSNNSTPIREEQFSNGNQAPKRPGSRGQSHVNYSSSQAKSTAFPPTSSVQNTPSMLPHSKHLVNNQVVSSPILPSQDDKSFNNQHYFHKISRSRSKEMFEHQPQLQHVRPDVVFTPLVSPHDTPVDSKQKYGNPLQTTFEPLTSPALNAQDAGAKRRSSSSVFSTVDENKPTNFKRRTPHGTPIMQGHATNTSNNFNTNGTNSANTNPGPGHYDMGPSVNSKSPSNFDKLPEASFSLESNSTQGTPMLPPQSFKKIDSETSTYKKPSTKSNSTSPQLMGFTMGRLAEQQLRQKEEQQQSTHMTTLSTGSINGINAGSSSSPGLRSRKSSINSSKSSDTSPTLSANGGNGKREKPPTKKASHKIAEQGRRNRMNSAVQSLGVLIPQSYHDQVDIPSKATTVELAAQYINDLLMEIDRLKRTDKNRK